MDPFRGAGKLRFSPYDDAGALGAWYNFGNCTEMSFTPENETVEVTSTDYDSFGAAIGAMVDAGATKASITVNSFDKNTLPLMAMSADAVKRSAAAGSVTDEAATATLGGGIRVAHLNISAVVVTDSTGTTTYTLTDDYTIEPVMGIINIVDGGAITDSQDLLIDYDYAAEEGYEMYGSTQTSRQIALALDGKNLMTSKACFVDVFKCTLTPTSAFNWMSSSPAEQTFELTLIKLESKSGPYKIVYKD